MADLEDDFVPLTNSIIRARILHTLMIYPKISNSMLQVGIGTAIGPKMWHPVMAELKSDGIVQEVEQVAKGPTGRDQTYKILSLVVSRPDYEEVVARLVQDKD